MGAYLPENVYNEFAREYEKNVVIEYSIIAGDGTDINDLYNEIVKFLKDSKFEAPDTMDYLTYHDDCPEKHEGHIIDFILVIAIVK